MAFNTDPMGLLTVALALGAAPAAQALVLTPSRLDVRGGGRTRRAAPSMGAEPLRNAAFVFVKPHAVTPATLDLVKASLEEGGITILKEGDISSEDIDAKKLVDQHYYAIASKATITPPKELAVPGDKFEETFGEKWEDVLKEDRAYTAIQACEILGIDGAAMDSTWGKAKDAGKIVKLGGGFYAGQLDVEGRDKPIYTFNAFYMSMRDRFTQPGGKIHYYVVEFDAATLPWKKFRGELLGPTDPATAPAGSIRGKIFKQWKELGLKAEPNTGDNGVHASASPFEGLAERMNWLEVKPADDAFGAAIIDAGLDEDTLAKWILDPVLPYGDGNSGSLFDLLEDTDAPACASKIADLSKL